MALPRLTSAEAVTRALDESDDLGRETFLARYGCGEAKRYLVPCDGTQSDLKAIRVSTRRPRPSRRGARLRGSGAAEFTFRHGLLRQARLSTLAPDSRRRIYGAFGTALETLFADALEDRLEVIAPYYARSDELAYIEQDAERAKLAERAARAAENLGDASQ